jgi:hypothetical protein
MMNRCCLECGGKGRDGRFRRVEVDGSGGEVNDRVGWLGGQRLPAVDLAHGDLSGGGQRPEQHGGGLRRRQDGLGLDATLELFVQPFDGIGGARLQVVMVYASKPSAQSPPGTAR